MAKVTLSHKLVWFQEDSAGPGLNENSFEGTFDAALADMQSRASKPGFILGQVLRDDGYVLATVSTNGGLQVNQEAFA